MASPIVSKRLIHNHLKSWQSITSQNNQTLKWTMFFNGIFDIDVESFNF